jgi:hypothetical protein
VARISWRTLGANDVKLDWRRTELLIGHRRRPIRANIAEAPDGSWYVVWRTEDGWTLGHAPDLRDPTSIREERECLAMRGDAQLIAQAWSLDLGHRVGAHADWSAESFEDDDGVVVSASWRCGTCDEGEIELANEAEAALAGRSHWRRMLRALVESVDSESSSDETASNESRRPRR